MVDVIYSTKCGSVELFHISTGTSVFLWLLILNITTVIYDATKGLWVTAFRQLMNFISFPFSHKEGFYFSKMKIKNIPVESKNQNTLCCTSAAGLLVHRIISLFVSYIFRTSFLPISPQHTWISIYSCSRHEAFKDPSIYAIQDEAPPIYSPKLNDCECKVYAFDDSFQFPHVYYILSP